jgi:quercetin dioxygenase-like cupin family protein
MAAYHHLWVISGAAAIAGRYVTAGSYLVIPPGVAHTVSDVGADGCLMLQIHRPLEGFDIPGTHPA